MSASMLCEELSKKHVFVEVFTTTANGTKELPVTTNVAVNVDGVNVTYFKRITKDHTHLSPAMLKALWQQVKQFNVVHIHAWWNLVSIFSCFIALIKGVPIILSPRGTLSPYSFSNKNISKKRLIHNLLGKKLLKKIHIHATSLSEKKAVEQLVCPLSITTHPNFVKLNKPDIKVRSTEKEMRLLFFSRIEEKKGLDILLNALQSVNIPFSLTIAGDGDKSYINKLKESVAMPALSEKITWAGYIGADKFELLASHDLLILPSHDENFGNVVIESLSVGTAVLISENVGLANYISEHKMGWVCQTTPLSVSTQINNIGIKYTKHLEEIRNTAPDIVRKDFTGDKLTEQYIQFYKNIIKYE